MKILKIIVFIFFGCLITSSFSVFAQEECVIQDIKMIGDLNYAVNEELHLSPSHSLKGSSFKHSLYYGQTFINQKNVEDFTFIPQKSGNYILKTKVISDKCTYDIETAFTVYENIIVVVGDIDSKLLSPYEKQFQNQSILVYVTEKKSGQLYKSLLNDSNKIKLSDYVIITSLNIDKSLQSLLELNTRSSLELKNKNIILVNSMNKHLLKRIVSKYTKYLDANKLYTTDNKNLINLIATLSNKENIVNNEYLTLFSLSEKKVPSYFLLSKMVDKLIYNGFPVELIGLLLTISLALLVVSLFRQVIGFDIFGAYTPLMSGLSIYILGFPLSLALFFFAFIATMLVRVFSKKVYLLYSAKISLLLSIYFLAIFMGLSYSHFLFADSLNFSSFSNAFVIFPMLLVILVSEKVFSEGTNIFSRKWLFSFLEFLLVSYVVYFIIHSNFIQSFMLAYPETIIFIILLIVLVGRFSGLQVLEYIRFYPFIKGQDDEEE